MTLRKRAEKLVQDILEETSSGSLLFAEEIAVDALKEQDVITRKACVKAINDSECCDIDEDGGWVMMSKGDIVREIDKCRGGTE